MNLIELKTQFLEYLEIERGRAVKTVENYDHYLSVFLKQTGLTDPKAITDARVRDFRIWLNRQSSAVQRSSATRSFASIRAAAASKLS